MKNRRIFGWALVLSMLTIPAFSQMQKSLMRFPDIHGNNLVFVQGEDIWMVDAEGGIAHRLTVNDGEESFPRFSPDGKLIAFSGQYDGNTDVYVMNLNGGDITRVTYHPAGDRVIGWHPVSGKILFQSWRVSSNNSAQLFLINPDGTGLERLPIHEIGQGSFSADGQSIVYNKVARENRTWKRYKGGTAQDLYLYNFKTKENKKLTEFLGTDRIPMWVGEQIFFTSDRDRVLNLYTYDPASGDIEQKTFHKDYDARRPSTDGVNIVYELGGTIWKYNIESGKSVQVPISIETDSRVTRPRLKNVQAYITHVGISPTGKRALITARGEVFSVPREFGAIKNYSLSSGSRELEAIWSPDGESLAWLSDLNGEYNLYLAPADGSRPAAQLTDFKSGFRHSLRWSPDGKKLSFTDQTLTLNVLDIATKKLQKVDKADYEHVDVSIDRKPLNDYAWSPDSRFIAYAKMTQDFVYHIFIYDLDKKESHNVSEGLYNDFNPVFTRDGKHLVFVSNRRFDPTFGDFEWEMVYKKTSGIYALTLQDGGEPLLPMRDDQEGVKPEKKPEGPVTVSIDFKDIANRIEELPLERGNYRNLKVNDGSIFFLNKEEGDFNRFEFRLPEDMDLYAFDLDKREQKELIKSVISYDVSQDGSSLVYRLQKEVGIIPTNQKPEPKPLALSNLSMWIDPIKEWTQIFNDAWRFERDYYYEPNMHGMDWDKMKVKYGSLVPFASCRQDVEYLIGELIGELNTSHTYIYGGDSQLRSKRVNVGMLGVDWDVSKDGRHFQFGKIYREPDWSRDGVAPLGGPGKTAHTGDLLLKVNGQPVSPQHNIYSYFQGLAGVQVSLTLGLNGDANKTQTIQVKPVDGEYDLRYREWVAENRRIVDEASHGQIGYVHLPDTYLDSAVEFPKSFFAMARKKGIIVDGRFNGGGLDPNIFLKRLNRKPHSYWTRRYSHDQTSPVYAPNAHMACLTNRQAGSGGDELPHEFQQFKMGPVIGTRSWGGLVGVSMFIPLIDKGGLTAPDYRIYDENGKWTVENEGVTPDIIVDLDPAEMERGYDAQLQKAIEVIMQKIKEDPRPWPKHPDFPVDK